MKWKCINMRVIAGKHKSKALESLEGRNTRPTMDKVKEGIFNSLHNVSGLGLDLLEVVRLVLKVCHVEWIK